MGRIFKMSLMSAIIIIVDQLTKGAVQSSFYVGESVPVLDGFFNFTYVRNTGAAFGMGAHANDYIRIFFFLFLPVVACFVLLKLIWDQRHTSLLLCTAYSLIFAGAVGNLIDRFYLGYVVDFLDFYIKRSHFPAFNVADSAITIAAFLLIIDFFQNYKKEKESRLKA